MALWRAQREYPILHFLKQRALFDRLPHLKNLRKLLPLLLQKHSDCWSIRQSLLQQFEQGGIWLRVGLCPPNHEMISHASPSRQILLHRMLVARPHQRTAGNLRRQRGRRIGLRRMRSFVGAGPRPARLAAACHRIARWDHRTCVHQFVIQCDAFEFFLNTRFTRVDRKRFDNNVLSRLGSLAHG